MEGQRTYHAVYIWAACNIPLTWRRWIVSGRTADLTRCGVEGALEVDCLAYTLKLAQERGANMSCEVKAVNGLIAARQQNRSPAPQSPCATAALTLLIPVLPCSVQTSAGPALFSSAPPHFCPALSSRHAVFGHGLGLVHCQKQASTLNHT